MIGRCPTGSSGLGVVYGQRSQAGAEAADQDDRPHRRGRWWRRCRWRRGGVVRRSVAVAAGTVVARHGRRARHRRRAGDVVPPARAVAVERRPRLAAVGGFSVAIVDVVGDEGDGDAPCRRCRSGCCRSPVTKIFGRCRSLARRRCPTRATFSVPALPSGSRLAVLVGAAVVGQHELVVRELHAVLSKNTCRAWRSCRPCSELNGWMWITPSPWVWMPERVGAFGSAPCDGGDELVADVDAVGGVPVVLVWRSAPWPRSPGSALRAKKISDERRGRRPATMATGNTQAALAADLASATGAGGASDLLGRRCLTHGARNATWLRPRAAASPSPARRTAPRRPRPPRPATPTAPRSAARRRPWRPARPGRRARPATASRKASGSSGATATPLPGPLDDAGHLGAEVDAGHERPAGGQDRVASSTARSTGPGPA